MRVGCSTQARGRGVSVACAAALSLLPVLLPSLAAAAGAAATTAAAKRVEKPGLPTGPVAVEQIAANTVRPHQDAWFVSELHQRIHSTIVFSHATIDPPREVEREFGTVFGRRDTLHGRVYLERSLANTPIAVPGMRPIYPDESAWFVRMFVDGKIFDGKTGVLFGQSRLSTNPQEDVQLTTWRFDLHPPTGDQDPSELSIAWTRAVNKLKSGRHRIRLEVWGGDLQQHTHTPRAVGELTLVCGKDDFVSTGRKAPAEGYKGFDRDSLRTAARKLFAQTMPPLAAEKVVLLKVWTLKLEPGIRHVLAAGRAADSDGDRVCEWHVIQVRQAGSPGAWRASKLEDCHSPECVSQVADCN